MRNRCLAPKRIGARHRVLLLLGRGLGGRGFGGCGLRSTTLGIRRGGSAGSGARSGGARSGSGAVRSSGCGGLFFFRGHDGRRCDRADREVTRDRRLNAVRQRHGIDVHRIADAQAGQIDIDVIGKVIGLDPAEIR